MTDAPATETAKPVKRRGAVVGGGLAIFLLIIAILPAIIAATPLRNTLLNQSIDDAQLYASADEMSAGWFSPVSMRRLTIVRTDSSALRIDIDRLETADTLTGLWWSRPQLGHMQVDRPNVNIRIAETDLSSLGAIDAAASPSASMGEFDATVRQARIVVQRESLRSAVIDVDQINLDVRVRSGSHGRILTVAPGRVLDHITLTPELCDQGLQLVAPILAESFLVTGDVSVDISRFRVMLDSQTGDEERVSPIEIEGQLHLHQVTTAVKSPLLQEITRLVAISLRTRETKSIRVLDNSEVQFRVVDKRVYHEGFSFVLPDISDNLIVRTQGSVGLDETLDLTVAIELPSRLTHGIPVIRELTRKPIELRIVGTLDQPRIAIPGGRNVWDELAARLAAPKDGTMPPDKSLPDAINSLLDGTVGDSERALKSVPGSILDIIRAARKADEDRKRRNADRQARPVPSTDLPTQ